MMPRPKSRKTPVEVVDAHRLAAEAFGAQRALGVAAAAILTGPREWTHMRRQAAFTQHSRFWPGGEETFAGVPVVVSRYAGKPELMATQQDLEDALLGPE